MRDPQVASHCSSSVVPLYRTMQDSVPRFFGIRGALLVARAFHVFTVVLLILLAQVFHLGAIGIAGVAVVALLLGYEHSLVSADDLSRLNAAFFTMNGIISMLFLFFVTADLMLK